MPRLPSPGGVRAPARSRLPALIGLVAAGTALLGALAVIALSGGSGEPARSLAGRTEAALLFRGVEQDTRGRLGAGDAPVRIAVFNDLQCRGCASWDLRTTPALVRRLVRSERARLAFHHFPMGVRERGVADIAAAAAGKQGREWQYSHLFFRNQRLAGEGVSDSFLLRLARAADLDVERWRRDRASRTVERRLRADAQLAFDLRLPARPAVTVEGRAGSRTLTGAPSLRRILAAVRRVERPLR